MLTARGSSAPHEISMGGAVALGWLTDLIDGLTAIDVWLWALLVASLILVPVIVWLVRAVLRSILRAQACAEFGLSSLPHGVRVRRGPFVEVGRVDLCFPKWRYPKRDGTADRRRRDNHLIGKSSRLALGQYRLSSRDPFALYALVLTLREIGYQIGWLPEEQEKAASLQQRAQVLGDRATAAAIHAAFAGTPVEFEQYCAELLRRFGYVVSVTPGSRDGGYDLELRYNGIRSIAECKCFMPSAMVGRPDLQKLVGANSVAKADGLMFITTASYSRDAKEYARHTGIELIDGRRLAALASEFSGGFPVKRSLPGTALSDEELWERYPADVRPDLAH